MKFKTDGLVIKENNVGENDRVVVIFTRDRGLISAFVSGARSLKSKNVSSTALLSFSNFVITKTKDTYRVNEAQAIDVFFELRTDIEKLALAQYICELCQALVPYEGESEDFLRLALNSLHFIANGKKDIYLIKAVTELRMMVASGFMPDLIGCRECGSDVKFPLFLDVSGGEIVCGECKVANNITGNFVELDKTTFAAVRHIVYSDFDKLYSFTLPEISARYLNYVTERYLMVQTDRRYKTLDFFHSLEIK